jgi:hypothetical protein
MNVAAMRTGRGEFFMACTVPARAPQIDDLPGNGRYL